MRRFVFLLVFAVLPVAAQTLSETLPNGLKIIVQEDKRAPVAVSQIWYRVGSIDEHTGKTGLSHALEHMMFKGTTTIPAGEFNRRVAALGGQNNAYTNRSETVYYENIAAVNLPEVLKMEADRMVNLNFSDKVFNNEMNVIREERRMRTEDSPLGKLWEQTYAAAYQTPSLRAPVIGQMADLFQLKPDDLRLWYHQWYAPNNATLVIVGDVNAKQTLNTAAELFGNIPAKTLPQRNDLNEPASREPVYAQTYAVTRQPLLSLNYRVPKLTKISDGMPYALDVLSDVLSGNSSSRLDSQLVRGKQSALAVGISYDMLSREPPLFSIIAMPSEGTKVADLVQQIRAEIHSIAEQGVGAEELQRVKRRAEADEQFGRDSMSARASLMGRLETRGFHYTDEAELRRRVQAVSAQEVQQAAQLLTADREVVVVAYPQPAKQ